MACVVACVLAHALAESESAPPARRQRSGGETRRGAGGGERPLRGGGGVRLAGDQVAARRAQRDPPLPSLRTVEGANNRAVATTAQAIYIRETMKKLAVDVWSDIACSRSLTATEPRRRSPRR